MRNLMRLKNPFELRAPFAIFVCLMALGLVHCASTRKIGWEDKPVSVQITGDEKTRLLKEGKKFWATRHIRSDLEQSIERFKTVAASDDADYETLVYLTRGYYILGDAHSEEVEEKRKFLEQSISWGEKALVTNPDFKKAVVDDKKAVSESVPLLRKEQIDALYWSAASLGKWSKLSGIATVLKYKNQVRKMIERVSELQPDYFYGAVARFWGVFYALTPSIAGGSMEKSLENFQKSFKVANQYLGTHVLYAEVYATKKNDRDLFKKELAFVQDAKSESIAELVPEQMLEKRKAKYLLENIDQYF